MGTSHEEPMMRSVPVEWNLFGQGGAWDYGTNQANVYDFWQVGVERAKGFEGVFTIGMRGNGQSSLRTLYGYQLTVNFTRQVIVSRCFRSADILDGLS